MPAAMHIYKVDMLFAFQLCIVIIVVTLCFRGSLVKLCALNTSVISLVAKKGKIIIIYVHT